MVEIRTTIAVLKAYAAGELSLENDLLAELEQAIEAAFNSMGPGEHDDYMTIDQPDGAL